MANTEAQCSFQNGLINCKDYFSLRAVCSVALHMLQTLKSAKKLNNNTLTADKILSLKKACQQF